MQILELLAIKYGMECVMLTVFKENEEGLAFYKSMKYVWMNIFLITSFLILLIFRYVIDEISPSRQFPLDDEESYEIMSKTFKRK